jgi:hypothetical protein
MDKFLQRKMLMWPKYVWSEEIIKLIELVIFLLTLIDSIKNVIYSVVVSTAPYLGFVRKQAAWQYMWLLDRMFNSHGEYGLLNEFQLNNLDISVYCRHEL